MTQAIKRGIGFYNFLGIMGIFDGSDGVLRFKQNFNGYIVRKMGTFRYYPQPLKYKAIQGVKKLLDVTKSRRASMGVLFHYSCVYGITPCIKAFRERMR